ncbi:DUF3034 family protein [Gilvimarinus sp. DA14]|uniref:DUF3034 family protein n=1 Tax=Gilvimarinus sp. DA14 TaxID=2956798 RepID=UPI0020B86F07|nr:DUF3034 family protein [Gilvimarinus sp. DA14]UTF59190.1 DUF3034 family protein [Gilvimarinus sp. DA14]
MKAIASAILPATLTTLTVIWLLICSPALGQGSRLLATGGATTIEGVAGGGIVPMAVISGYCTREEIGATAFTSYVDTPDYSLASFGAATCWRNRFELSVARQRLEHPALSAALGVSDQSISQSIVGAKVRLAGDLLYTRLPQLSLGVQYKDNHDFFIPAAAGAIRSEDTELYLAASKVYLGAVGGYNLLVNAVARYTRANQAGLVGFGGDQNDTRQWQAEVSSGIFINRHWLLGAEYRQKPNNLSFAREDDWYTGFLAWFPNKNLSLVAAYADLGEIATLPEQDGWYLSLQGSF